MNIRFKNILKFLDGGAMAPAPEEAAPAPELGGAPAPAPEGPLGPQGGDPMEMLMLLALGAMLALLSLDANMAFLVCDGLVLFVQMVLGGQGGPGPEEAPGGAEPVYRRGGTLVRRIRK